MSSLSLSRSFAIFLVVTAILATEAQADIITGLVTHYTFDASGASLGNDSAGTNNGTAVGGATQNATGIFGGALQLDGINDAMIAPHSASLENQNFTVSAWIKPDALPLSGSVSIVNKSLTVSLDSYWLRVRDSGLTANTITKGTNTEVGFNSSGPTIVSAGVWNLVNLTYDGATLRSFIDGMEVGNLAIASPTNIVYTNAKDLILGSRGSGTAGVASGFWYDGLIDDVGIWNRALTNQELAVVNGLGKFAGINLANSEITDVLDAFLAGPNSSAVAGGLTWYYSTNLGSTTIGATGGSVGASDAFIVLDSSGNGVTLSFIPEPSGLSLICLGFAISLRRLRRR